MGNYFTPLVVWVLSILAVITAGLTMFHHSAVKGEDNKYQAKAGVVIQQVQEKKNEIINLPRTDARSIDRLQRGSFFPTR